MSSKTLRSGRVFGRWTLGGIIGEGGNGVVWTATDTNGGRGAIKFIKSHYLKPEIEGPRSTRLQRFVDEIAFLRSHAGTFGVIQILDYFCPDRPSEFDRPWFVTELGVELRIAVAQSGAKVDFAVGAIARVANTLAGLHAIGAFHRDIKPENILVIDGLPLLSDFGLVDFPDKVAVTRSDEFLGPLFYLAPEMMTNAAAVDFGKADVYSLAKSLWVVVTGQKYPLLGEQRVDEPALTLSAYVNESRCRSLDRVLAAATRHDPSARPTMRAFADELEAWIQPPTLEAPISERLVEIAKVYRPMLDTLEGAQKWRERCDAELVELTSTIHTEMKLLTGALDTMHLRGATGTVVMPKMVDSEGEPTCWYDWPAAPRPNARGAIRVTSLYIMQQLPGLNGRSVAYCGGFRLTLVEDERLFVAAAHAFGSINSDAERYSECTWKNELELQSGMPTTMRSIKALLEEFATHLPDAIAGMLELMRRIGHLRPT